MPIFFDGDNEQVQVEFIGGDIIAGLCGDSDNAPDCIGIAEAPITGISGELLPDEIDTGHPAVTLTFHTIESLDSFIAVLKDYRAKRFVN